MLRTLVVEQNVLVVRLGQDLNHPCIGQSFLLSNHVLCQCEGPVQFRIIVAVQFHACNEAQMERSPELLVHVPPESLEIDLTVFLSEGYDGVGDFLFLTPYDQVYGLSIC